MSKDIKDGIDIIDDINVGHIADRLGTFFNRTSTKDSMSQALAGFWNCRKTVVKDKVRTDNDEVVLESAYRDERSDQSYKVTVTVKVEPVEKK